MNCSSAPTWRCTRPRPQAATPSASSTRTCRPPSTPAPTWRPTCPTPCPPSDGGAAGRGGGARAELLVYSQPVVDHQARLMGAEALVRWRHPQRGMIGPADFIPLAEQTGLILPL